MHPQNADVVEIEDNSQHQHRKMVAAEVAASFYSLLKLACAAVAFTLTSDKDERVIYYIDSTAEYSHKMVSEIHWWYKDESHACELIRIL